MQLLLLSTVAIAQDVHFSQHWATPLYSNPAQTGFFNGDWRLAGIYRNQWKAISGNPNNSIAVSYDRQDFYFMEQINSGILIVSDQSGTENIIKNKVYLTGGYLKKLDGHKIGIAIQPGIVNLSAAASSYTFDSQYDLGGNSVFNSDMPSNEDNLGSKTYFDLNAGLMWTKRVSKKLRPTAGIALHHLTMPSENLLGAKNIDSRIPLRTSFFAGADYAFTPRLHLIPMGMYATTRRATNMVIGGNAEYYLNHKVFKTIYLGPHFRYGWRQNLDASIWVIGTKFMNFDVAASYDVNVSGLSEATNNRGAFEISLIFISDNTKPTKIQIPCDRL